MHRIESTNSINWNTKKFDGNQREFESFLNFLETQLQATGKMHLLGKDFINLPRPTRSERLLKDHDSFRINLLEATYNACQKYVKDYNENFNQVNAAGSIALAVIVPTSSVDFVPF